MRWRTITKINNGALSRGGYADYNAFKQWADSVGVTQWRFVGSCYDIPALIRGRRVRLEYVLFNPDPLLRYEWFDHGRIYRNTESGQRYIVSHIYNKSPENISALEKWCAENELSISYLEKDWYYPGVALGVVITAQP